MSEDVVERAFGIFEKQSKVDYFVNKNNKEFLRVQFNLWLYQYVISGESKLTEKRIKQLRVLRNIVLKIIDFISKFEDELVKIWNKSYLVLSSNYVITLERTIYKGSEARIIEKVLNHKNIKEQIKEWNKLGIVSGVFNRGEALYDELNGKELNEKYKFLTKDIMYFKDLEHEILDLFDDFGKTLA